MRLTAITTLRGVNLSFTSNVGVESVTLRHSELEQLSAQEGVHLLINRLFETLYGESESGAVVVEDFPDPGCNCGPGDECDGCQTSEERDHLPFDVEVQTPAEYLRERGHIS